MMRNDDNKTISQILQDALTGNSKREKLFFISKTG